MRSGAVEGGNGGEGREERRSNGRKAEEWGCTGRRGD